MYESGSGVRFIFMIIIIYLFLLLAILLTAAVLGKKISKILKINYEFVLEEFLFSVGIGTDDRCAGY